MTRLVAGAAIDGIRQIADNDVEGPRPLLQLRPRVVHHQLEPRVGERRLVCLQVRFAEVAYHLYGQSAPLAKAMHL